MEANVLLNAFDDILTIFTFLDKGNSKPFYIIFELLIKIQIYYQDNFKVKKKNFHLLQCTVDENYNKDRKRKRINALNFQ